MGTDQGDADERSAALFKALGSPLRLRILRAIAEEPRCVHDLVALMGVSQPLVSQHLRVLRNAMLLESERVGRESVHHLADHHIAHIINDALAHVAEAHTTQGAPMSHTLAETHTHSHGTDCGHQAVQHEDHVDYLHDGHAHRAHEDHYDECAIDCSCANCSDSCQQCDCTDCSCATCQH